MTTAAIEPLTEKQAQAFAAIKDGASASDVAKAMSISPAGAHSHIKALIRKGYINDKMQITYAGPVSTDVLAAKPAKSAAKAKPAKSAAKAKPKAKPAKSPRYHKPKPAPTPPTFDEMVAPASTNGRHPTFEADAALADTLSQQRDLLAKTVEQVAMAVEAHQGRITAIDGEVGALNGEKTEHLEAIASLEVRAASLRAALADLDQVASAA